MLHVIRSTVTRTRRRSALVALAVGLLPAAAAQAHRGLRLDVVVPDPCPPAVVVEPQPTAVWVEPVYRTAFDRQWVEPVYQTVTVAVWVPPVTAAAVPARVFVPDRFGWRTVVGCDLHGRTYASRQWVLVAPAHYEDRCDAAAVVTPGHYADVPQRQLLSDGHWADVERQELVTPGHGATRVDAVAVPACPPPRGVRIRLPF